MSERKDMTIQEIEEVLKEYTCEFEKGKENWYVIMFHDNIVFRFKTKYDFTKMIYFKSSEKIEGVIKKIGLNNFSKYFMYLDKDLTVMDKHLEKDYLEKCKDINEKLNSYSTANKNKSELYKLGFLKENNKYEIKYIKFEDAEEYLENDGFFSTLEEAKNAVKKIGEYNVLCYVFYVRESALQDYLKNELDTTQKDMVKNPSHYQGKYGLEVYDVLENFLEDVESYYVGNIIKYILRYKKKNKLEDIKKAREYADKLIERYENGN